jgi:UPF0716 family protein affecting phage T7 exclusion
VALPLILFFVVMPLIELAVFVQVVHWIGALNALGLLLVISIAGVFIVRHEGLGVWRRVRAQIREGLVPAVELVDGLIILIAGVLLILPGFVTSIVGLLLLLPPVRGGVRRLLRRRYAVRAANQVVKVVNTRGSTTRPVRSDVPEVLPPSPRPLPPSSPSQPPSPEGDQ